jgi:hypothetical protein
VADSAYRNLIEFNEDKCKVYQLSQDPDSSCTVKLVGASQIASRKIWKEIQESCKDCRMAIGHIKSGVKL